jgi:hypothetical protein
VAAGAGGRTGNSVSGRERDLMGRLFTVVTGLRPGLQPRQPRTQIFPCLCGSQASNFTHGSTPDLIHKMMVMVGYNYSPVGVQ